jgi:hypothetical protein
MRFPNFVSLRLTNLRLKTLLLGSAVPAAFIRLCYSCSFH